MKMQQSDNKTVPVKPIEVPVVAYPLRGFINPYWAYLVPLIFFSISSSILSLLALIAAAVVPVSFTAFRLALTTLQGADTVAIIMDTLAIGITSALAFIYMANLFNFVDSRYTQVFNNVLIILCIGFLLPINVLMVVAEGSVPEEQFDVSVNRGAFVTAGILGLVACVPLLLALFFSRFYEYCIGNYKNQKNEVMKAARLAKALNQLQMA